MVNPQDVAYEPLRVMPLDGQAWLERLRAAWAKELVQLRDDAQREADWNLRNKPHGLAEQGSAAGKLAAMEQVDDAALLRIVGILAGDGPALPPSAAERAVLEGAMRGATLAGHQPLPITARVFWWAATAGRFWQEDAFEAWRDSQPVNALDLRAFADLLTIAGRPTRAIANDCLRPNGAAGAPQSVLPQERVWPFFAMHPEYLDMGLGLAQPSEDFVLVHVLDVLCTFPEVPARWVPRLTELALGDARSFRALAQRALAATPGLEPKAIAALADKRQDVRIAAAEWLAQRGQRESVPALHETLSGERSETVRAAVMSALEALGEDMSPLLSPTRLLAQARKGLAAKLPSDLDGFALDGLPACRWASGEPVASEIIRWWLVLACKLKLPGGHPMLDRYLGLLDAGSRNALGLAVLQRFILHDTRCLSLEAASAAASLEAPARWAAAQRHPWRSAESFVSILSALRLEYLQQYASEATQARGVLALASVADGAALASAVLAFMRAHRKRHSAFCLLMLAASRSDAPEVVQMLLTIERVHRNSAERLRARALIVEIAERRQWTADELSDRCAPTAGLDAAGMLPLSYGPREFVVMLDGRMAVQLKAVDGKSLKALPAPRADDNAAASAEAKAQLSRLRKDLPALIAAQRLRLYEAMCTGRRWSAEDWRQWLQDHPVVGRLVQRLFWQASDGRCFRPTEDGGLIDAADEAVVLAPGAEVLLAHGTLLDDAEVAAWQRHLADCDVEPLFDQWRDEAARLPSWPAGAMALQDRSGREGDAGAFIKAFTRLGYRENKLNDRAGDPCWSRDFTRVGVRVLIGARPSWQRPSICRLKSLSFHRLRLTGRRERPLPLDEVPPIVLAEAWADYLDVARQGFETSPGA